MSRQIKRSNVTEEDIMEILESDDSSGSDFEDSDDFEPSDESSSDDDYGSDEEGNNIVIPNTDPDDESDEEGNNIVIPNPDPNHVIWSKLRRSFTPRFTIPDDRKPEVLVDLEPGCSELKCFQKIFPRSLYIFISQCTNERLQILREKKKKTKDEIRDSDSSEIMLTLGCLLVMSYNKLPNVHDYWSQNPSMGNQAIKMGMARNRFQLLMSKLYFNHPKPPKNAPKTYYIDEMVNCLKYTFLNARGEIPFQSLDESMTKFKGRSSLKQYMPLKPIKRGIKIWERCDSITGYAYDFNVYSGKNESNDTENRTLGERVVMKLAETIREPNVVLAFDRFFTSVWLLTIIDYPALGTCIMNRKNVPKFDGRLQRGEHQFRSCSDGLIAARWQDSKDFVVISNCHMPIVGEITRKQKDGSKLKVSCPNSIIFYNQIMGGVDLSDQKVSVYDCSRKSTKWWKKVFYKLLMSSVVNAWILYNEVNENKTRLLQFLVPLAEQMMAVGKENSAVKRRRNSGRPSKIAKTLINVGDHLPVEAMTRRRCARCSMKKKETRTKQLCQMCNLPLCKNCFTLYHTS